MKFRLALVLLISAGALSANGDWKVVSSDEVSADASGRHVRVAMEESASGAHAELHFALFQNRTTALRVVDQPNESRADLASVMESERCLAGVNGGYFAPDYAPVGLLISNGRTIAPLRKARLLSGVVSVMKGRVRLQRAAEFSMKGKITEALQCGPFLVDRGHIVAGLDNSRSARRTFVATDSNDGFALGYCSSVSLAELSRILIAGKIAGTFKIERALNLDGGSSSAFWFRDANEPFSISERKTVRDFVAIVPK